MRVMLGFLLLACLGLVSAARTDILNPDATNTFHITTANSPNEWVFGNGAGTLTNPTLNMTIGTTYYISIEFNSVSHPFGLNNDSASFSVDENGLVVNGTCAGTAKNGYTSTGTAPCVLSFVAPNSTSPLYYHCTVHSSMWGNLQLNAAAAAATNGTNNGTNSNPTTPVPINNGTSNGTNPTTPVPTTTTAPPTTPAPSNSINADTTTNTFHVTGVAANNGGWIFTSGGVPYTNPTLNMAYGKTYTISIETPTPNHPFGLSKSQTDKTAADLGLVNPVNATTSCGVTSGGYTATTTCAITFSPPAKTPQPLYYHCVFHDAMVGQIAVSGLPNSGFALVPGFVALFAIIAALFAQ